MKNIFAKFSWKVEGMDYNEKSTSHDALFHLKYNDCIIGILSYNNNAWHFEYTETFKMLNLAPLSNFPEIDKHYTSESLWPFFATRIPSFNQPFFKSKIDKANINKDDSVDLLKLFGKRTITNPYQLDYI